MHTPEPGATIFVIGAGPIVIGQACEFDYAGCQACKVLREKGYRTILLNSNPATIMTDPHMADATYVEPMTVETCRAIIAAENPKYLLPTMGGQTALNLALALHHAGALEGITLLGASIPAIEMAENRKQFKALVDRVGYRTLASVYISHWTEALEGIRHLTFPLILRPSFTLGGQGGMIVHTVDEYLMHIKRALDFSPIGEVLVEQSCAGWKEIELEVMKDGYGNSIIVCGIENMDPMGIHTGDSITVAPLQTVSDPEYQDMRNQALRIMDELGIQTGGANIQFCQDPKTKHFYVIEVNPRVSRSSALASKATGFPIAKVATLVAVGERLDQIINDITRKTPVSFEPALDYVVAKLPKFNFDKFPSEPSELGVSMKAIGETMAIGRTFEEALQKGLRAITQSNDPIAWFLKTHETTSLHDGDLLRARLGQPTGDRIFYLFLAFAKGMPCQEVADLTHIHPWFLEKIRHMATIPAETCKPSTSPTSFSVVDTCAGEFASQTPYGYMSSSPSLDIREILMDASTRWVAVIGSGPNHIGQGLEFDYLCVQAVHGIQSMGCKAVMLNNNPETVSTDYDCADALLFEPIAPQDVVGALAQVPNLLGVVVMMGGQSALNVAHAISQAGIPILGSSLEVISACEDRARFRTVMAECGLRCPMGISWSSLEDIRRSLRETLALPLIVRPSYVIGGSAVHIFTKQQDVEVFGAMLPTIGDMGFPMVAETFLAGAFEYDCDVIRDEAGNIVIAGILEHVEPAGIHSGDSTAVFPPVATSEAVMTEMTEAAKTIAQHLKCLGLMNIQFAHHHNTLYVLEINPRGSRTVPFLAKATGIPFGRIATEVVLGKRLDAYFPLREKCYSVHHATIPYYAVKKPIFPFDRFKSTDVILGPQMKSTGEVMGIAKDFCAAYDKALTASGHPIPPPGATIFVSLSDEDKPALKELIPGLSGQNYQWVTTKGTHAYLTALGIASEKIYKHGEGHPDVLDWIGQGRIHCIWNTTRSARARLDELHIRRLAIRYRVPYCTNVAEMRVIAQVMRHSPKAQSVCPLQKFHRTMRLGGNDGKNTDDSRGSQTIGRRAQTSHPSGTPEHHSRH